MTDKKLVILFSKEKVKAGLVILGEKPEVKELSGADWNDDNLEKVFTRIKEVYKSNKARIVLDDDINYVLDLNIPKDVENERAFIGLKISEKIPENFENDDWGFKEIGQTKNERQIKVFAPVKEIMEKIRAAVKKAEIEVEAIEPASVSIKRNPDPMIGMAMKPDIKGKDEKKEGEKEDNPSSENKDSGSEEKIEKTAETEEKTEQVSDSGDKTNKFNVKVFAVVLIIFLVIGAAVSGGIIVYRGSLKLQTAASNSQTAAPTVSLTPTSLPSLKKEDLKISVLNGSGIPGLAGTVKELLENAGYRVAKTGNAEAFTFQSTQISVKDAKKEYLPDLVKELSGKYEVSEETPSLDQANEFDIVIKVGKNKK